MTNRTEIRAAFGSVVFLLGVCIAAHSSLAASSPAGAPSGAKQESTARGYIFVPSHSEIVDGAKKEGKLRVLGSLSPNTYKQMISVF